MKPFIALYCICLLCSCTEKTTETKNRAPLTFAPAMRIEDTDRLLRFDKGSYYYGPEPFNGIIIERYANSNIKRSTGYLNGKEEDWQISYYPGGELSEKRYYHGGEKDSVHTGWWENGRVRFEYHFKNGIYNGDFKEWFANGRLYKHIYYSNGVDEWGMGWRENGKQYMNYVVKDGRRYGIINSNLCYTLKDEAGEYTTSAATR